MVARASLLLLTVSFVLSPAAYASPNGAAGGPEAKMPKDASPDAEKKAEDESPFPKFEKVTKDMTSAKGLFTLWSYPESAKNKDQEKLLCQIPKGFLGEKFMLSTSFSGGGFFTGFSLEQRAVQWKRLDKQLLLIEPDPRFVVDQDKTVHDVVERTYPDRIRAAVPIVTLAPGGDPVIDLGPLLKSGFADIAWTMRGGGGVNASLSKWTKKKSFELNVEIGVALAMGEKSPPGSYVQKLVHYSFWKLPKSDYKPRIADDRVGYFVTVNQDWSKPANSRDIFNRYVDRWDLQKRDPSLALCEPKAPIIYYIEKTVPVRYRRAVRDGILEWNKAYEKVGFVGAVEVRQQTETNEWKDLDPEDMRYSFFRWIVSGAAFAMGPHRSNPYTGQIYDADIIFDDSMVRVYENQAGRMLPSALVAEKMRDPAVHEFLTAHPEFRRASASGEDYRFGEDDEAYAREALRRRMRQRGMHACDYMEGMRRQLAVAHSVLAGQPREVIDKFLYDIVKEIVMHEVGHTLGLRHNFKASTIYTMDEVKRRRATGQALVGSVMDYNPTLFFHKAPLEGHFLTPTIGPYDYWAIEYGYRPADGKYKFPDGDSDAAEGDEESAELASSKDGTNGKSDEKEKPKTAKRSGGKKSAEEKMLSAIASRAAEPELAYASDEDTTGASPDPRSNRFDMGANPINWSNERFALVDDRLANVLDWSVDDDESWYHARGAFLSLLFEKSRTLDYVGRYIGGLYTSRSHRGDPDADTPFEVVDADTQRKAMTFIEESLFDDDFFAVSPEVLNHLTVPRWWHEGASISFSVDFPIHDYIGIMQWWNLFDRLYPNTLRRIYDSELKTDAADKFTLAEYLIRVRDACWGDADNAKRARRGDYSDTSPYLSSVRRSLQREYLNVIEPLVRSAPGALVSADIHGMVQHSLRTLGGDIDATLAKGKLDFASEAHLTACKSRIERMLAPRLDEYGTRF